MSREEIAVTQTAGPAAVALGYFDGVHLGHRAVLGRAIAAARAEGLCPAAFTFTLPHEMCIRDRHQRGRGGHP